MIDVFRKTDGTESVVCRLPAKNAKLSQERMARDEVSIQVVTDEVLPVREMDYIRVDGEVYTLNRMADYDEVSDVEYRYNLIFEGVIYNLMDKMYVYTLKNTDKFSLTATLQEFAGLLAENINAVDPGWTLGEMPETARKNLLFESVTCREVLNKLAGEFGVEYYLKRKQINFVEKFENKTSLVFERGKGKGLYKLTCKNADSGNTVTRVRVYGSTENLPVGYRANETDRLQLPMADGKPVYYLEDYSEFKKVVEKTVHFDDIKPSFTGVAAAVSDEYNRRIVCPEIDFNFAAVAVGDGARINFLTGDLTGVSFKFAWDNTKKEINLVRQEDGMALPDADNKRPLIPHGSKKPNAGDTFNFTGINLPQSYVDRAENDLLAKGREWLSFYKQLRVNFGLEVDHRYLQATGQTLHVGDVVTVKAPKLKMEKMLRILSVQRDLDTGKLNCTVSNYITESWEKRIEGQIQAAQSSVDSINLNAAYLVEASKEWVAKNFARLFGGNKFIGRQEIDGDVELADGRRFSLGAVVMASAKDLFRTVLSVTGKEGEEVEVETAGVKVKKLTADEISTPEFVSGFLGSGARLKDNHLELDEITIRKRMNVRELMIERVKSVGGALIVSVGAMKIADVADMDTCFRCSFDNDGGNIANPFVADDQVMCQAFTGNNIKRYWRRVAAAGADYFDLSKTDCEAGSAVPEAGDEVVQLGHRSDPARQKAVILCATGADAPYTDQYDGINDFSLEGKLITREGNLSGIVDDVLGQLSGTGFYGKNVYLRGKLALASGKTVDTALGEVDAKSENAKSTADSAKELATNTASEVSKTNAELTKVTRDVQVLADAQTGFNVRVSEVQEKAEAAQAAADGIQIGGVNLINSLRSIEHAGNKYNEIQIDNSFLTSYNSRSEFMLSFYATALNFSVATRTELFVRLSNDYDVFDIHVPINFIGTYDNKRFEIKFGTNGSKYTNVEIAYIITLGSVDYLSLSDIMIESGNKASAWTPSIADQKLKSNYGKLFLRGTGENNNADRQFILNNDGVNRAINSRGLNLIIIRRSDLTVLESVMYDIFDNGAGTTPLIDKLNSLDSSVIVTLTSFDSSYNTTQALIDAISRCGGSGSFVPFSYSRIPYAFVGIPGIGKGTGIEVFTTIATDAPYAEISTQIINGIPSGMNGVAATAITAIRTELQTNINAKPDRIELEAINTQYNALGEVVTHLEGRITTMAGDISAFVKKGDLISEINLRPEGIRINANKIEITGDTVFRDGGGNVVRIFGSGNDVFNINNAFKVDKDGKAVMRGAEIEGEITATCGKIGNILISNGALKNDIGFGAIILRDTSEDVGAIIGTSAVQSSSGSPIPAHFYHRKINTDTLDNVALMIEASGARDYTDTNRNIALLVRDGGIVMEKPGHLLFDVSGKVMRIKGLSKISNTNGWDRVLVNLSTGKLAYG